MRVNEEVLEPEVGPVMKKQIIKIASGMAALVAGCTDRREAACMIDPAAVLEECDVAHVANPWVAAWDDDGSVVAVVGMRGTNHVLVLAHRDPESTNPNLRRWQVAETSIIMINQDEYWVIGERDFPHAPTRMEILDVCRQLQWTEPEALLDHWSPRVS